MDPSKERRHSAPEKVKSPPPEKGRRKSDPRNSVTRNDEPRASFQKMISDKFLSERVSEFPHMGREPKNMKCPHCKAKIKTEVKWKPNMQTHFIALLLCVFILWPCICLPYCIPSCGDINHYCPRCKGYIGSA